jgi:secondary thiamine-phosphate synthase enzyme
LNNCGTIEISTKGKGLYEITDQVRRWLSENRVDTGLLTVFIRHTSASLIIQENADPDVQEDLNAFFDRLAPDDSRFYKHNSEGPDDMPAHIRAALTLTQVSIPVIQGRLGLGTWQGIYVFEHREAPQQRSVLVHLLG